MSINEKRIQRAQKLMREEGMLGIMIMNHDDYLYFFGTYFTVYCLLNPGTRIQKTHNPPDGGREYKTWPNYDVPV